MRVLPVVGETLDSRLNDVFGYPLSREDVFAALEKAAGGLVAEGNVGGGTGMVAYGFKGGIGTSSRIIEANGKNYTVGVLLQANHGRRDDLRVAGIPVGREIKGAWLEPNGIPARPAESGKLREKNSLLIVIATDAPLMPHQLERMARRAALALVATAPRRAICPAKWCSPFPHQRHYARWRNPYGGLDRRY
jgi:L-aminopeptidase/D-esterase-like protein